MKRCWKTWIKAAAVRAIKTVAQTAVATIGTSTALGQVDWVMVGSASLLAGVLSLLTSLTGLPECKEVEKSRAETAACLYKRKKLPASQRMPAAVIVV